ncbi:hypothetical protein HDK90DRAFT_544820 [Phyllosticta capitalensis]|uniref:Uncharacterized protein n=1 Tax=Phyllosticta capitalensis TaxID=121624 RepID=A0ABR1YAQ9_9PEZI
MFCCRRLPRLAHRSPCLPRSHSQKTLSQLWDSLRVLEFAERTYRLNPDLPILDRSQGPKKIQPLVFSAEASDWVRPENEGGQFSVEAGSTLPVVLWNMRFFGKRDFDAIRSKAAMTLLRNIFGERPRPMAIMLHEVELWTLRSILEHWWVRKNFHVGFDDGPVIPIGPGGYRCPLPSVLMVSSQLRCKHWILVNDLLSVDLPVSSQDGNHGDRKLLRLGMIRLVFDQQTGISEFEKSSSWIRMNNRELYRKKFDEFLKYWTPQLRKKKLQDIQNYMKTGYRPRDRIVASVLGCDITDSGVKRSGYKWTKTGAASMPRETQERIGRLVQFRSWGVEQVELSELHERFVKHGINGKVDVGLLKEQGSFEENRNLCLPPQWMLRSGDERLKRLPEHGLGWPRNKIQSDWLKRRGWKLRYNSVYDLSEVEIEELKEHLKDKKYRSPSFAPLKTNDYRFNFDLVEGRILMWVSDDFGIAMGIKVC